MPIASRFTAFSADLFVKFRAIAIADGIAAFFSRLAHGHLSAFGRPWFGCHSDGLLLRFGLALKLLSTFLANFFVERGTVLTFGCLAALTSNFFVELTAVFCLHTLAAPASSFTHSHAATRIRVRSLSLLLNCHGHTPLYR